MPVGKVAHPLLALPRGSKRLMAVAIDVALCALTVWIAFYLRLGYFVSLAGRPSVAVVLSVVLALPAFYVTGLYRIAFRSVGSEIMPVAALACTGYGLCYATIISAYAFDNVPRTVGIIQPILLFLAISAVRMSVGYTLGGQMQRRLEPRPQGRVVIYGAGSSGRQLAAAIEASREFHIVGFLDDDRSLYGTRINGLRVYPPVRLSALVDGKKVDDRQPDAVKEGASIGQDPAQLVELSIYGVATLYERPPPPKPAEQQGNNAVGQPTGGKQ